MIAVFLGDDLLAYLVLALGGALAVGISGGPMSGSAGRKIGADTMVAPSWRRSTAFHLPPTGNEASAAYVPGAMACMPTPRRPSPCQSTAWNQRASRAASGGSRCT